jgi:hypothetical protein
LLSHFNHAGAIDDRPTAARVIATSGKAEVGETAAFERTLGWRDTELFAGRRAT